MGSGVEIIGSSAFADCSGLESINLPASVRIIAGEAFFNCTKLEELYLSNQLTTIGANIIRGCNNLGNPLTFTPGNIRAYQSCRR